MRSDELSSPAAGSLERLDDIDSLVERTGLPAPEMTALRSLLRESSGGVAAASTVSKRLVEAIDATTGLDGLASSVALAEIGFRLSPTQKGDKASIAATERLIARAAALDWDVCEAAHGLARLIELTRDLNSKQIYPLIRQFQRTGRIDAAVILVRAMLRLTPYTTGVFKAAMSVPDRGLRNELVAEHLDFLRSRREDRKAIEALAYGLLMTGDFQAAAEVYEDIADAASDPGIAALFAEALFWTDRFSNAVSVVEQALSASPTIAPKAVINLAKLKVRSLVALGKGVEAADELARCRTRLGEAYAVDATDVYANLAAGRYHDAFKSYWGGPSFEAMRSLPAEMPEMSALTDARDSGHRLEGECCILSLMGVGDEVRMAQMLPDIAELFDRVTLFADRRLAAIFARSFPNVTVLGIDPDNPVPGASPYLHAHLDNAALARISQARFVADMRQFPAILRSGETSVAHRILKVDPATRAKWAGVLAGASEKLSIGLFWRSDIVAFTARHKQTELTDWLAALDGLPVSIVPLQYGISDDERRLIASDPRFVRLPETFDPKRDVEELFGLLTALPKTIALPGSTQHMAGAVGADVICPAHPFEAGWRRRPGTNSEVWAPSAKVICGSPEQGLKGSMDVAVGLLKDWLAARESS